MTTATLPCAAVMNELQMDEEELASKKMFALVFFYV